MREVAAIFVEAIDVRKIDAANIAVNDGERRSSASDKRAYVDREALRLLRTDLGRVLCEARWNKVPPRGGWLAFLETRGIAHQRDSECREYRRLAAAFQTCRAPWVLSYDDHSFIRDLYQWAEVEDIQLTYTIASSGKKRRKNSEVVIVPRGEVLASPAEVA